MATLTGKITDVTSKAPENITSITVKAPSARIGGGTDVIVSSPATVDFNRDTGDITISGLTGGLSWLYIEGDGWSDSIALSVAEGMITLVEAVANAAGAPGLIDFIGLLLDLRNRIDGIAQDAVDEAAENIRWFKGFIDDTHVTMADVPVGLWGIASQTHAVRLGLPADFGTLQVMTMGSSRAAFFIGRTIGLYINTSQDDVWGEWHQPWAKDKWFKGAITNDHQTMNDVAVGVWNIPARNHAVRLGLPMDYGSLQVMQIGLSKTAFFIGQTTGFWINSSNGDVWGEWQRPAGSGGSGGGGAAGLKTVGMALTAGSLLDGVAGRYRVLTQVTAPVVRWRIHVESRRMLSNTTSAFTLGAVYVGNHSGNGAMTGQQQIKSGNLSVPAGGEWESPWLDASLLANETLIDLNVTGSELYWSQATSWVYEGGAWVSSKNSPVAIWVELETYDQVPVVGMIGDSTGGGQGADRPVFDSALYIAARNHSFIPMAYTYPGSSMESINDYGSHLFQRWAHLDKPDSVIIQSGSNDIHAGTATAELQTRFADLVETAEMISPVVIGATVKARYPDSGEHQTTLNAHNAFVKTRANGNRDYLDFYQAVSPSGTVASADAADAAHLSTAGHQKLATAFDSVTVARPAVIDIQNTLESKADKMETQQEQQAIRQRVAAIETKPAGDAGDTAFAHVTEQGHRLPLGYGTDGRLDTHARKVFAEDVTGTYETADGEYVHAVTTGDMHLLWGIKADGTVEIPGLKSSTNEPYYAHRDGSIQATAADTGNITVWGSSTPNLLIPSLAAEFADLPVTVNDMAQGGERAEHTAARLGAVPALIDPVTIPATGAVDVTSPNFPVSSAVWGIRGFLGGVYGILNSNSSSVYFTRLNDGEAVQIGEQTEFIPELGPEMRGHVSLVGAGKNNITTSTVEETCKLNDQIFEYLTPLYPRVLWLGMHHNTGEVNAQNREFVERCNAYFEKRFGPMYFDIKAIITSPDIWDRVGLTPTNDDLAEQAAGNLAPSLAMDGAHLSETTNAIIADGIRTRMNQLGWY